MSDNMTDSVRHWRIVRDEDDIVWLHLDMADSKVNLLASQVILELSSILDDLSTDIPAGIVILSDKTDSFIFGADIKEFRDFSTEEDVRRFLIRGHELMDKLEAMPCPTVSMVHGYCLGGGTELSLACDYIIASNEDSTRIGLPEIKLGIFPGYGGSVRSIRRCGAIPALDMMLTGRLVTSRAAKRIGLIDELVPRRQLEHAAKHFIVRKPHRKRPSLMHRLTELSPLRPLVARKIRQQVRKKARPEHYPAPFALIDHWLRFAGDHRGMLKNEIETVTRLALTDTARNLLRVYFLQEELKAFGKQVDYKPAHVHVIGGGIMGGDIASWCAIKGYSVSVQDQDPERLSKTLERARTSFSRKFKRNRRAIRDATDRLIPDHRGDGIKRADIIIEAIFEDADVKRELYQRIEPDMKADAILATNTSSIRLEELSDCLSDPARLVGLHFFNPVALMPLVEVIEGEQTGEDTLRSALSFAQSIGKLPLPTKSSPGFLVNRILMPYLLEAVMMIDEGIPAEVIDRAATDFGMPMGPIELADTVGLDICRSVATILADALDMELPRNLDQLVEDGDLGKKSGRGFYRYEKGKAVRDRSASWSDPDTVQQRLIARLLNESQACHRESIVDSADLIDAGVIFGTGFAPFRGGPLNYIRENDPATRRRAIEDLAQRYGDRFEPDAGWDSL